MIKLIRVMLKRLFTNKAFLICLLVVFGLSLFISCTNAPVLAEWRQNGDEVSIEEIFFNMVPLLGLVYGCFSPLFLGTEHSDGTLRNKLIGGYSRLSVYASMLFSVETGCFALFITWILGSLPSFFWLKELSYGTKDFLLKITVVFFGTLLFSAINTAVSMLISNKATGAVITMILFFILLFAGSALISLLGEPEMAQNFQMNEVGQVVLSDSYPNPYYVSGIKRTLMTVLVQANPCCQQSVFESEDLYAPIPQILYQLAFSVVIFIGGCFAFMKKDLK